MYASLCCTLAMTGGDREPVEFFQSKCYVLMLVKPENQTCSIIINLELSVVFGSKLLGIPARMQLP